MTLSTVDDIVTAILADEGGVADVHDGQGVTRWGQTPEWLAELELPTPTSRDEAADNYHAWLARTRLTDLCQHDLLVGYVVTDFAVHSGVLTAVRALQRVVCVTVDGLIGGQTLGAVAHDRGRAIAAGVLAERLTLVGDLLGSVAHDRRVWARGWLDRVGRQVRLIGEWNS